VFQGHPLTLKTNIYKTSQTAKTPAFRLMCCYKLAAKNNLVSLAENISEGKNCFSFNWQIARKGKN